MIRQNFYGVMGLIFIFGMESIVQSEVLLGGAGSSTGEATVPLSVQSPSNKVPLIIHRMPSTPPAAASRNRLYMFADETLLSPGASVTDELDWCRFSGASAVVQDEADAASLNAAREAGIEIVLLPNMADSRLSVYGVTDATDYISVATNYFCALISKATNNSDVISHQDDRPVMWLFGALRFGPAYYENLRDEIRSRAAVDPVILYQAELCPANDTLAEVEAYMDVFDGAFIWEDGYDRTEQILSLIKDARDNLSGTNGQKRVVLTVKPGHWRPEKGLLVDTCGTQLFRETIELAYSNQVDGLNIESWNDYSEMHHVQPSVMKSAVLSDLCAYYGTLGTGQPVRVNDPGMYISHRRQIVSGEVFDCEVLQLPVDGSVSRDVQFQLKLLTNSVSGPSVSTVAFTSTVWAVSSNDACAKTFSISTREYPVPSVLMPVLRIDGVEYPSETFCEIVPGRMSRPYTMNMKMADALHPGAISFTMDGFGAGHCYFSETNRVANISIQNVEGLERVEIIKNDHPVYSVAFDEEMSTNGTYQVAGFYWDIPATIPELNIYPDNGGNFDGSIDVQNGEALRVVCVEDSCLVTNSQWTSTRLHGGIEVVFSGDANTDFTIEMPNQNDFSEVINWGDVLRSGVIEYPLLANSRLLVKPIPEPIGHPCVLGSNSVSRQVQLSTLDDKAWNVYFLRIITTNQCIYRSAPIYVTATDPTETVETYVWDTAQSERYRVRVPKASLHDVTWSFSTNSARMIPDLNQTGYFLQRGGMYERDGRYYPTQEPMLVDDGEGCVMQFDGSNDVAMTWPQLLPLGCWMLDMWINPVDATPSAEQFIFQVEEAFSLILKTNGAVRTWFGDRTTGVHLTGTTALQDGQWHRVSFVYDLNHIYLLLDGEVEDSAVVKGLRERISLNASLGASVPVAAGGAPGRGFYGKIRDVTISSQLESMDALTADVIYEDNFDGSSSVSLTGQSPDQCPDGEVWFGSSNGNVWMADGSILSSSVNQHRNVFLPFSPSTGKVYRLTLIIDGFDAAEDWVGFGFCKEALVEVGFGNSTLAAAPWFLHSGDLAAVSQTFVGPGTADGDAFEPSEFPAEMKIVVDTRGENWTAEWYYNNQSLRRYSYATPPNIEYVGFGRFGDTGASIGSFTLTCSQ